MKINYKRGNGASILGLMLILIAFIMGLCFVNYFNLFNAAVATQTRTDAIADGMAIACNDGTNVPNVQNAEVTKQALMNLNKYFANRQTYISNVSFNAQNLVRNKILEVEATGQTKFFNYLYYFSNPTETSYNITTIGKNKTRVLLSAASQRLDLFPTDERYPVNLSSLITSNDPKNLTPSEYRRIVLQFEVELTERYQPDGNNTKEDIYLWDVTSALGCELPYYYKSSDGSKWDRLNDGYMYDNGSYRTPMYVVGEEGGYLEFVRKYIPATKNGLDTCPTPYNDYNNWHKLPDSSSLEDTITQIQSSANAGHPTILLYQNGSIEIVVPEFEGESRDGSLFVSYAASVPSNIALSNANTKCVSLEYKEPQGNFIALTYY